MDEHMENRTTKENSEHKSDRWAILFHDMVRGARKYWWLLAVLVAACASLGLLVGLSTYRPMYKASATFTVKTYDDNNGFSYYYDNQTAAQMALTFPYLLDSDLLLDQVKTDLGVPYLNGAISAETTEDTNLFTLTVTGPNPQDAYDILLAVINNYPAVSQYVIGPNKLQVLDRPSVPDRPYNASQRSLTALAGGFIGLVGVVLFLLFYALTRNTLRREEEIQRRLNVPCLGSVPLVIPKRHRKAQVMDLSITNDKTGEAFIESLRRTALYAEKLLEDGKVLLVTSTIVGEGVTLTARNLALALAETGKQVLLLDGHLTEGGCPQGLERYLLGNAAVHEVIRRQGDSSLWLTGCDKELSRRDLTRTRLHTFIEEVKEQMDYILIDAPACQRLELISPLLEVADAAVYVIKQDEVKAHRILACFEDLTQYDTRLLGCVFNGVAGGMTGYGYHYGYGYGYRYGHYGHYGYRRHHYGHYGHYGDRYGYGYRDREDENNQTEKTSHKT